MVVRKNNTCIFLIEYILVFGPSLLNSVKFVYSNVDSCVLNNGWTNSFLSIEQGVRQGGP